MERIAASVVAVERFGVGWIVGMERGLFGDALASGGPHVGNVDVLIAAVRGIEPAGAHAGAGVVCAAVIGYGGERAVAVVAIEIAAAEVVRDVQVRCAVAVGVTPRTGETVAVVFCVEAGSCRAVNEVPISFIMEKKIGRAIARVEIRRRVVVLIEAEIIGVETKVDVEAAIAIVVGQSGMGECAQRRLGEGKRARLVFELSVALIDEEKRAGIAYDEQILQATIFEIGEQRAGSGIKDSDAGFFRDVFERAVAAVSVEAVWQARRLTDVEVVETVVVEISCSDAVVAVNVDAGSAVENSAPVIRSVAELVFVRRAIC